MRYEPDKPRAFPADSPGFLPDRGMTLRDYFAAKAMQGRCAGIGRIPADVEWNVDMVAADAYRVADAMLKARQE